jgi:SAM-dependent methyltransferase
VVALDRDPAQCAVAQELTTAACPADVHVVTGEAGDTGLKPGSFDAIMMRHVLVYNGGCERAILRHLVTLLRPGGHLLTCEPDISAARYEACAPEFADMLDCYATFLRQARSDIAIGPKLGALLDEAGLTVRHRVPWTRFYDYADGIAPTALQRAAELIAAGLTTEAIVARWRAAVDDCVRRCKPMIVYSPVYTVAGRRPD